MEAPSMQVKCGVNNCVHYASGMCHANSIEVNAMGDGNARSCEGTCCSTFVSK